MNEEALKVLSDHSNPREARATALRQLIAECVAALPELPKTVVRQTRTLVTGSAADGHTLSQWPSSAAKVAHVLSFVPPRPDYPKWLEIISGVATELPTAVPRRDNRGGSGMV